MNKFLLFLFCTFSITISSCKKDIDTPAELDGRYSGTFERKGSGRGQSEVTLVFNKGNWAGWGSMIKYPAIATAEKQHAYKIHGHSITFEQYSYWTAEFDWTLILNGNYTLENSGKDKIKIYRKYKDGTLDIYNLTKDTPDLIQCY